MSVEELLADWRSLYAEWVSTELQLRAARQRISSGRIVQLLEEKVRSLKKQCSDRQDAVAAALSTTDKLVGRETADHQLP